MSKFNSSFTNLLKNKSKLKLFILIFLVLVLISISIFSPFITPFDPYVQNLNNTLQPPNAIHLLGTDRYGRDLLSRVIIASQASVLSTLLLVTLIAVIGMIIGCICGYYGGKTDIFLMRSSDIFLAFPGIVFAIAVAGILGGGIFSAIIALVFISWPKYARLTRSQVLLLKNMPFVAAAKLSNSSDFKIITKHFLPNIISPILITAMLDIGTMMIEIAGLSFLGLGAMPPTAEWGSMMSSGRSMLQTSPWVILAPGCAIFISVMLFNLLGDTIRDVLDPKQN